MGNSAMSSCVQLQVAPGQCSVRVLQADGKVLQFSQPVLAIQVMQEYPGHLVVKDNPYNAASASRSTHPSNSPIARQSGYTPQSSSAVQKKRTMLRADEVLQPGNTYYLLPIRGHDSSGTKKSLIRPTKTSARVASSFEYEDKSEARPEKHLRRSISLPSTTVVQQEQHSYAGFLQSSAVSNYQSLGSLLREGTGQQSYRMSLHHNQIRSMVDCRRPMRRPRRPRKYSLTQIAWKPELHSIPEFEDPCSSSIVECRYIGTQSLLR